MCTRAPFVNLTFKSFARLSASSLVSHSNSSESSKSVRANLKKRKKETREAGCGDVFAFFYSCVAFSVPSFCVIVVLVLHELIASYNAVRGHRTGSNNSGVEDYLRRETNKNRR